MIIMVYPVEDEWAAEVLDLPGCVGAGDTPQEALNGAIDAGRAWLKLVHSLGEKPPKYSIAWLRVDKEGKIGPIECKCGNTIGTDMIGVRKSLVPSCPWCGEPLGGQYDNLGSF